MKRTVLLWIVALALGNACIAAAEPMHTPSTLLEAFAQDPANRTPTYEGEVMAVTGVVVYVGADTHGTPSIELAESMEGKSAVVAVFDSFDALKPFSIGEVATVSGSFHIVSGQDQVVLKHSDSVQQDHATVRSFSFNGRFSADVHVLHSPKGNILVDPGFFEGALQAYVEAIGGLDAILLTHGHWDNIYALDTVAAAYPDAAIYLHALDREFLRDPVLNCSINNGFSLMLDTEPTYFTEEGTLAIGGHAVRIMHTPGHTVGSCCFYLEEENILFSGDMFMVPFVGSANHPTGSEAERAASIEKFLQFGFADALQIFPGHRGNTTYKDMLETNIDLR